jgi:hypothetical protein
VIRLNFEAKVQVEMMLYLSGLKIVSRLNWFKRQGNQAQIII